MPPTIDDFIELLAAYGLELQGGANPLSPTGIFYTINHSRPRHQRVVGGTGSRYGESPDLATLQRQVMQKLRQDIGDDNEWLAVMRSAYGNINLGVDDIPIAQATQGELDDALSGKISRDEDEMFFGGVPKTDESEAEWLNRIMSGSTQADRIKAYEKWSQDPQRRLKRTPVGYEDYIASLQADAPITAPTTVLPPSTSAANPYGMMG